jgi:hypothetical protein
VKSKKFSGSLVFICVRERAVICNWKHPQLVTLIAIARDDGEDAPRYLERLVEKSLQQLESMSE